MFRLLFIAFFMGITAITALFAGIAIIDTFVPINATFQSRGVR